MTNKKKIQKESTLLSDNRKLFFFLALGIIGLYLVIRLFHLTSLPIFTDEAIYIRWAQIAKQDAAQRFISLTDGKQPAFIWAMIPLFKLFRDPLMAGRMVSVLSGLVTTVGMFFLGKSIFRNTRIGIVSALLYVLFPLAVVDDRMALYETMAAMFTVWSTYLTVILVRSVRLDIALILSMVMGGGMLTKTTNFFSLPLLPLSLLLFDFKNKSKKDVFTWVGLLLIAAILSYGYYNILRLSPFFHIIAQKNTTFIYPIREWITHPFTFFYGNLHGLSGWLFTYMTIPVVLLVVASFVIKRTQFFEKIFLFLGFIMPFLYLSFFGKILYPRWLLFMAVPLLILAAYTIVELFGIMRNKRTLAFFVTGVMLLQMVITDGLVLTDFAHAPIPVSDREQYLNGWSAGGGVKEAVAYFNEQAKSQRIYIATEGTFGLMPFALEIYLVNNPNITIKGYWPIKDTIPPPVVTASKQMPTYFLFYQPRCMDCTDEGAPKAWQVTPVLHVTKGVGKHSLTVYKL